MIVPWLPRALSLLLSLLAFGEGAVPRLAPEAGLVVEKELVSRFELTLEGWGCVWNGAPVPEAYLPKLEVELVREERFHVVDEYLDCRGGRHEGLRRSFESVSGLARERVKVSGEVQGSPEPREASSPLEGALVRFGPEGPLLERGEAPAELLAGLEADLDLTVFLPPAGRVPGEAWTVPAAAFSPLVTPGGELGLGLESEEGPDPEQLADHLEGEWRVRLVEAAESGDPRLELEGRFETWAERATDLAQVPIVDGAATERTTMRLRCTGELVWRRASGVLGEARIESEVAMEVRTERDLEGVEGEPTYVQTMRYAGSSELELRARPR